MRGWAPPGSVGADGQGGVLSLGVYRLSLLPKSLSGLRHSFLVRLVAPGAAVRAEVQHPGQAEPQGRWGRRVRAHVWVTLTKPPNLNKKMVGLGQLDMSLLCQLYSLDESIQETKERASQPPAQTACRNWKRAYLMKKEEDYFQEKHWLRDSKEREAPRDRMLPVSPMSSDWILEAS
ncbi:protein FAM89A-like [Tenrec ecaudatus]|uniref:protein FAM89A-like n=1 Tax=Tenrec ecaudatus TaxID=94439 RepID=UPI003F59320B